MRIKSYGIMAGLLLVVVQAQAQQRTDSAWARPSAQADSLLASLKKGKLSLEGYVDVYYSYAFSHPVGGGRPYVVNYSRDNEINLDLAYISLKYNADRLRATFTPGYGTYMNANYTAERQTLQNILEAYVGIRLFKNKDIWLDGGVFSSPYTNETVYSFDQLTYTRSLGAENTPYYLTGAKLTVPFGSKWTGYFYLLNGWQVIQSQHDPLDYGTQLEFKPTSAWDINFNTYIGNESSVTNPGYRTRYFGDLYATYNPTDKWNFSADAYTGWQRRLEENVMETRNWWNANVCARYLFLPGNSISVRLEHFDDRYEVLAKPVTNAPGFRLGGASLGYNLNITNDALLRFESRYFGGPYGLYALRNGTTVGNELWLTVGLTARLR
jgi:hypothetical protein